MLMHTYKTNNSREYTIIALIGLGKISDESLVNRLFILWTHVAEVLINYKPLQTLVMMDLAGDGDETSC